MGLKCLSAFGFWGTALGTAEAYKAIHRSQMPFGFWVLGNGENAMKARRPFSVSNAFRLLGSGELGGGAEQTMKIHVSNAFRLLGSGERITDEAALEIAKRSQMPFGFWVLGNGPLQIHWLKVSNGSQMPFGFWVLGNARV